MRHADFRGFACLLALALPPLSRPVSAQTLGAGVPPPAASREGSALPVGSQTLRADHQEVVEKGHFRAWGFVDLSSQDMRIQAERMDVYETERPDGTKAKRAVAEENVVFMKGEQRLSARRMEMDMETGIATLDDASGYLEPGVYVEARRILRIDDRTYRVEGGTFTACAQPSPRWSFSSTSARVHLDDKVVAKNAVFRVKDVPSLYLPIIAYPLRRDDRSTGFLFPRFGTSSVRGFMLAEDFYWAMGRSADQTFSGEYNAKFGWGLSHELRYTAPNASNGDMKSLFFRKNGQPALEDGTTAVPAKWEYDLDWGLNQALPGKARLTGTVNWYSDLSFLQQYAMSYDNATRRTRTANFTLQRNFGRTQLQVRANSFDTFFQSPGQEPTAFVSEQLPSVSLSQYPRKLGHTALTYDYRLSGDFLARGNSVRPDQWSRYDGYLNLAMPFGVSFLRVGPRVQARYSYYDKTLTHDEVDGSVLNGPGRGRPFLEGALSMTGPTFQRVYLNEGGFYSERFKHVIGPEVNFLYRTKVDDITTIPTFDGVDSLRGTSEVQYGIVQRLYAKRPGRGGKTNAYEFFSLSVGQTYYFKINEDQNSFDPNYSSTSYGPGGLQAHRSALSSRMRFRTQEGLGLDASAEYDVNFKQFLRLRTGATITTERFNLSAGWTRATRAIEDPAQRKPYSDAVQGSVHWAATTRLTLDGRVDYNFALTDPNQRLQFVGGKLRYSVQCCGIVGHVVKNSYRNELSWGVSIELAHVGSAGYTMGDSFDAGPINFRR